MGSEIEETAKATRAVAETAGKAVDASVGLGGFMKRVFGPALYEFGAQLRDNAAFRRERNLLRLQEKWERLRAEHEITAEPRPLPFKIAHGLIEAASLEEDEDLQDCFAALLFNTTDSASHAETRHAFITMLREMSGFDVKVLFALARAPDAQPRLYPTRTVYTAKLPDGFVDPGSKDKSRLEEPPWPVMVALNNLARLGCVVPAGVWDGAVSFGLVTFSPLGQALVAACTVAPPKSNAANTS